MCNVNKNQHYKITLHTPPPIGEDVSEPLVWLVEFDDQTKYQKWQNQFQLVVEPLGEFDEL